MPRQNALRCVNEDEELYLELVRRHPRPTDSQIASFATFVATDHSWYKHLPRTGRGEPFFFYLDPHVHEEFVDVVDGGGAWRPIVRELGDFPFPTFAIAYEDGDVVPTATPPVSYIARRATTAEWRERYGILSYWNYGPPDQPPADAVESARRGLRYADDRCVERPVAPEGLERGLVYLRATIFPGHLDGDDAHGRRRSDEPTEADHDRQRQFIEMIEAMSRVVSWAYDAS